MRYLALGDSYTLGTGIDPAASWPRQLAALLGCTGHRMEECKILGRGGWSARELRAAAESPDVGGPYDLVTLQVGLVDQQQDRPAAHFLPDFVALLRRAIALSCRGPSGVDVLSLPEWGATPYAARLDQQRLAMAVDIYNAAICVETLRHNACYVDIRDAAYVAAQRGWLAPDGLHYSGPGYRLWAEAVLPMAIEMAGQRSVSPRPRRGRPAFS